MIYFIQIFYQQKKLAQTYSRFNRQVLQIAAIMEGSARRSWSHVRNLQVLSTAIREQVGQIAYWVAEPGKCWLRHIRALSVSR